MVAATHRPLAPTTEEIQASASAWAQQVDWRAVRIVVWCGSPRHEPWRPIQDAAGHAVVVVYDRAAEPSCPAPRVHIVRDDHGLATVVESAFHTRDRVEIAGEPDYARELPHVREVVSGAVEYATAMEATIRAHSREWVELGLAILHHLVGRPAAQSLPPLWSGRPAVVIGAGPSLDDDLETLQGLGDKALVLAASTAAGTLVPAGVPVHVWACAEQREAATTDLCAVGGTEGSYLLPGVHTHDAFYRLPSLGAIPLISPTSGVGAMLAGLFGLRALTTGGSVTTFAYALARQLGADPIILVGQDCGIPADGRTHTRGRSGLCDVRTEPQIAEWRKHGLLGHTPAWGGIGQVMTTPALRLFRRYYESQIANGDHIINTSRRGARISGAVEMHFDDLRLEATDVAPLDALTAAVAEAPRMGRDAILARLRDEKAHACAYAARGRLAARMAHECVAAQDAMHMLARDATLAACMAVPPAEEVHDMLPRQGVLNLVSLSSRVGASDDALVPLIDRAIRAVEETDD